MGGGPLVTERQNSLRWSKQERENTSKEKAVSCKKGRRQEELMSVKEKGDRIIDKDCRRKIGR